MTEITVKMQQIICAQNCISPGFLEESRINASFENKNSVFYGLSSLNAKCTELENLAKVSPPSEDCFAKYGVPSSSVHSPRDMFTGLREHCVMACEDPAHHEELMARLASASGDNNLDQIWNAICRHLEQNEQNDNKMQQCFDKYGSPKTAPSSQAIKIDIQKHICAQQCFCPEMFEMSHIARQFEQKNAPFDGLASMNETCNALEIKAE